MMSQRFESRGKLLYQCAKLATNHVHVGPYGKFRTPLPVEIEPLHAFTDQHKTLHCSLSWRDRSQIMPKLVEIRLLSGLPVKYTLL